MVHRGYIILLLFATLILGEEMDNGNHQNYSMMSVGSDLDSTSYSSMSLRSDPGSDSNSTSYDVMFKAEQFKAIMDESHTLTINVTGNPTPPKVLILTSSDTSIMSLPGNTTFHLSTKSALSCDDPYVIDDVTNCTWTYDIIIRGEFIGSAVLMVDIVDDFRVLTQYNDVTSDDEFNVDDIIASNKEICIGELNVIVVRTVGLAFTIYMTLTYVFLGVISLGFGAEVDIDVLKYVCKIPIAPAVGFFCQFGTLPVLGFVMARYTDLPPAVAFGLLAFSCAPGGGMSNVWSKMLGGNLTLSLFMTSLSNIAALGIMPFWMWLLGPYVIDPSMVVIPYLGLMKILLSLVCPLVAGFLINWWMPRVGQVLVKISNILSPFFALYHMICIPFVNGYIFEAVTRYPNVSIPAVLLPVVGFVIGYPIAVIAGQNHRNALTIAIETGIQNAGIPLLMLMYAFPQPYGDLGAVLPMWSCYVANVPLYLAFIVIRIAQYMRTRYTKDLIPVQADDVDVDVEEDEGNEVV